MFNKTAVDILISVFITEIYYSTFYLNYRGVDLGTRASDVNTIIRGTHAFNKKYLRLIPSKLDASVLYLTAIQLHWYVDIFPFHKNASSVR